MSQATRQAVIMLASHFYESRDGSTAGFWGDNPAAASAVWDAVNRLLILGREWKIQEQEVLMSFGKMNQTVTILKPTVTTDDEGFTSKQMQTIAMVRAYREGRHGSSAWANRAAYTRATDLFRIRIIPILTSLKRC